MDEKVEIRKKNLETTIKEIFFDKMSRKRKSVEVEVQTTTKNFFSTLSIQNQWQSLSWNTKHHLREALEFFAINNCSTYISNLRSQISTRHQISLVKIIFYLVTTYSQQQLRSTTHHLTEEEISLFSRCAYIVNVVGKKNLDPSQKDYKRVKWPFLEPTLSISEILFYWFIFKYEIAHYFQKKEEEIETIYIKEKQGRGTGMTKNLKTSLTTSKKNAISN